MPTATDEPSQESAPQDTAGAHDSLNGAGAPESTNGMHSHDVTVAAEDETGPGPAEPEPEVAEPESQAAGAADPDPGPDAADPRPSTPAASVFTPAPGPPADLFTPEPEPDGGVVTPEPEPGADVFTPEPEPTAPASSIFVHDPSPAVTAASMSTEQEPPPAAAVTPGEEPPAQADDPFGAYRFGPASHYSSQPDTEYTSGLSGHESGYVAGYAAETGYNHGTQPVEEETAPPPAYPADLPASPAESGARSTFASAYRSLPKPKQRSRQPRAKGEVAPARRANLVIARLEPWSVMKFSFLISLVAWVVLFVAVALLYYALSSLGVFESIQKTLASVTSSTSSSGVNLSKWTSAPRVLGYTMLVGAVDVILITALSTIGAMVYNLVTHLGGGIEVTLKETD